MGIRNVFTTKSSRFDRAIERNDVADMQALMQKKSTWLVFNLIHASRCEKMSPEMMTLLMTGIDKDVLKRWGTDKVSFDTYKKLYLYSALEAGRTDLADIILSTKMDFNSGDAASHPASYLLKLDSMTKLEPAQRMDYLRRVMAGGTDKLKETDVLVDAAVSSNYIDGARLLASIGFDLRKDSERALRLAAGGGHGAMCAFLIDEQGADIAKAISVCEALGAENNAALFLRNMQQALPASEKKPATLESLQAEVDDLRRTVRTLSAVIEDMRAPEKDIGKKQLGQTMPRR